MSRRVHYHQTQRRRSKLKIVMIVAIIALVLCPWIYFSRPAGLVVESDPTDAHIQLGDETVTGQLTRKNLPPGRYQVKVSRAGFESAELDVEVRRGKAEKRQIALAPQNFKFSLTSTPQKAVYQLILPDGSTRQGQTPFEETVRAGAIQIKLEVDSYQAWQEAYFLDHDSERTVWLDKPGQLLHLLWETPSGASPKGASFSPDGAEIWTTLLMGTKAGVNVFRAADGEKRQSVNLKNHGGVEVIFSRDGTRAYVSQMETDTVFEIDTTTREILRTFPTQSSWCKILELSPGEQFLYVSNWSGNNISEIDLQSGTVKRLIPTVGTPRSVYATRDGQYLYVAGFDQGELQRIRLDDLTNEILFRSGGALRHIAADEERGVLYISDMTEAAIYLFDINSSETKRWAETDSNPNTIVLSPDKKVLFVSCRGTNAAESYYVPGPDWGSIQVFDTATGQMLDAIVGGNQPTALAISPDGTRLVSSNFLDGTLALYQVPSYEVLKNGQGGRSKVYRPELMK